jgi:hypothetical protein
MIGCVSNSVSTRPGKDDPHQGKLHDGSGAKRQGTPINSPRLAKYPPRTLGSLKRTVLALGLHNILFNDRPKVKSRSQRHDFELADVLNTS